MTDVKLFLNGARWWLRLPEPCSRTRVSTGTADRKLAERIAMMVGDMADSPSQRLLLLRVERGECSLLDLYNHRAQGTLVALVAALDTPDEISLDDHLATWAADKAKAKKGAGSAPVYLRQIRTLYPTDAPFTLTTFTRKEVYARLNALEVDAPTRNRYKAAVSSFAKYLVLYDVLESNFVRDIEGFGENEARVVYYERPQAQQLMSGLSPEYALYAALAAGFCAEWCAFVAMEPNDLDLTPGFERAYLRGTKTSTRRRWVPLVDENRWVLPYLAHFHSAQREKLLSEPMMLRGIQRVARQMGIRAVGEELFSQHTLHDWRSTHVVQLLRDGYSEQIAATHAGHKNTDMVRRKYGVFIPTREDYARAKSPTTRGTE